MAPTSTAWSENGRWNDEDELAEAYMRRKGFAYGRSGRAAAACAGAAKRVGERRSRLSEPRLASNSASPRSDHYFDTLGGISRAVRRARGGVAGRRSISATRPAAKARCARLSEQVALETRTRALNPKWYEGMLKHGYEGVRQIEAHVTNTHGLVGDDRRRGALGLRADVRNLRAGPGRCASGWRH